MLIRIDLLSESQTIDKKLIAWNSIKSPIIIIRGSDIPAQPLNL